MMRLSGDFAWNTPLSVDDIASDLCPVRKDLYNDKARNLTGKQKDGKLTWGRLAGRIVEPYCTGLLGMFDALYKSGNKVNYQILLNEIESYSQKFFANRSISDKLQKLSNVAAEEGYNSPEHLQLVLQYSARNELATLGADWILGEMEAAGSLTLTQRVQIEVDKAALRIKPKIVTGISGGVTPDFRIKNYSAVGDVKTGREFKRSHQLTCAGYALARESELETEGDTNFGIVYFVETHAPVPSTARPYFFVVTDALRREFLDKRDKAYAVLSESILSKQPPEISSVDRKLHCIHCKFLELCDHDRELRVS